MRSKSNVFFAILFVLAYLFFIPEGAFAGYCSGGRCLPGPPAPGQIDCSTDADCIFGEINLPEIFKYGKLTAPPEEGGGLIFFLNNILKLLIVIGGLFAFFNIILAGYGFMSAGDDPKAMGRAWAKIWQSLLGLLFIAGSFVLAAIFGWLLFGDPTAILVPRIYGP